MGLSDVFGSSEFLKASDIQPGRQVDVVIDTVSVKSFEQGGDKLQITFRDKEKSLVCNKTNAEEIAAQHGDKWETNWAGKRISLYQTTVAYEGKTVPCIRVVPMALMKNQLVDTAPAAGLDVEIPF
jgi:hypothetical protein